MQQQMQQMQQQTHQQINELDRKLQKGFDDIHQRTTILNINSIARTQNFMISFADRQLSVLVDFNTAEEIPDFPSTASIIPRMSSAAVNRMEMLNKGVQE
ncbi:hypothetical protein BPOR_0508g00010 [Botrytis porri]|uniref:Uncharacterized protein n=1 Tax=Botrytis porri TaxID=87229 RepID=A0A4Z1KED6_9HELO|nr:hypothetical protein BPOR_0508g00010 [Botrytis porri]